ncbi:MAG: purine-nucleoside phosphorylase [Oscillospiraceae bacterium]|jgi:purine-nucleoside phosphorylase|nr:purine-nucleoside phosphorylase [Oscillospiraceae bacterium]
MPTDPMGEYKLAVRYIRERLGSEEHFPLGLVLGSGLGRLGDSMTDVVLIPFADIPGFGKPYYSGHRGNLLCGTFAGKRVVCLQGRLHYYEGYTFDQVILPIRVLRLLGVETLLITNAAGGINTGFAIGDIMLMLDHINLMGGNPMVGNQHPAFGQNFFDMGEAYSKRLLGIARKAAAEANITLREGVYIAVSGPSYETPAEIRAFRTLGADAVGMSTVPEVIAARHAGMEVLGLSLITNMAAGVTDAILTSEDVIEIGHARAAVMEQLAAEIVRGL